VSECERCHRPTIRCEVCKGKGSVPFMFGDCTECDGTGEVCPVDGKHWKR
jgi:RecJ-like exonuclease